MTISGDPKQEWKNLNNREMNICVTSQISLQKEVNQYGHMSSIDNDRLLKAVFYGALQRQKEEDVQSLEGEITLTMA